MNLNRRIGFFIAFFVAIFLLFSCDQSKPFKDLHDYIDKLKSSSTPAMKESDEAINKQNEPEPAIVKYESESHRSPFEVRDVTPAKGGNSANPLQAYPLDMLRFVGTVSQNGSTIAFVSTPDNKIYQIKVGDTLGDHDSKVITIDSDRISMMEEYTENGNAAMKRVVTLQLKEVSQ